MLVYILYIHFFSWCFGFISSMFDVVFIRKREINQELKSVKNTFKGVYSMSTVRLKIYKFSTILLKL